MKYKLILTAFLTAFLTVLPCNTTALASVYTGHLDSTSEECISGWAWDSENPSHAVNVQILVKNSSFSTVQELSVTADLYYSHLSDAGIGTGKYGFSVSMNWSSLPDGFYFVEAYVAGTKLPNCLQVTKSGSSVSYTSGSSVRSLGVFQTTAYCPCYSCSEGWGRHTSTGAIASARHTIAVDPRVIPYGSRVMINGMVYTAEDRGGAVKGNHIDIFFDTHGETRQYGTQYTEVFLLQ